MEQLTLNLTLEEINTILDTLGTQPYKEVYQLIAKIQQQANAQLQLQDKQRSPSLPGGSV